MLSYIQENHLRYFGTLLLGGVAGAMVYTYITRKVGNTPPEARGAYPLVGHIPVMAASKQPHKLMQLWWEKQGDVYQIRLATRRAIVINGLNTIREAFVDKADDFSGRPDFYPWQLINNGRSFAFGTYNVRWRFHKKLVNKAIKLYMEQAADESICVDAAYCMADEIMQKAGEPQITHHIIHNYCAATMFRVIFGAHFQPENSDAFFRFKDRVLEDFVNFVGPNNPINIMPWTRFFLKEKCSIFHKFVDSIQAFVHGQAAERMQTHDKDKLRDVLDALLATGVRHKLPSQETSTNEDHLTIEDLYLTCTDLLEGGATSTITFLNWSIVYYIRHPEIFSRAQYQIDEVIGREGKPSYADRARMPYVEAVISEIFRHSSFASGTLPHMTTRDTKLKGFDIPSNTLILCNLHSITRDPDVWGDPETFNPDRFLLANGSIDKKLVDAVSSFGIGRRRCVGENIAKLEAFIFFVVLIQKCDFKEPDGGLVVDIVTDVAIEPKPYRVVVEQRTDVPHERKHDTSTSADPVIMGASESSIQSTASENITQE